MLCIVGKFCCVDDFVPDHLIIFLIKSCYEL